MIPILKRMRSRAHVKRLRDRTDVDPYPRSYVELCKALLSQGRPSRAMDMAREGLTKFPHSEDLRDLLRHTWRHAKSARIEELRRRCDNDPAPDTFRDLAAIYLECEEYDEALAVADEYCRREPTAPEGMLLQGEILIKRFYKDLVANDARRGIVALQKVLDLEARNFEAQYQLASVYHFIGAISKALFHMYQALDIDPDHDQARNLHDELIKQPLEQAEENTLLRELEEGDGSTRSVTDESRDAISRDMRAALIADLNRLSQLNGVTRAAFVSIALTAIAERGESRVLEAGKTDPLCEIAKGFRKAAAISSKRMGIGAFQASM
ncbi:MAG: hypothetical protein KDB53_13005, partial [Planctomycetes bacterium]|nr:hypothetical protein [Planctomycetota bacterium]